MKTEKLKQNKLQVIIYAMGTKGDINPFIGLSKEIKSRGHDVVILSNSFFESSIRAHGIDFFSVGTVAHYHKGNTWEVWRPQGNILPNITNYHLPAFAPTFEFVKSKVLSGVKNLIIVSHCRNNGARVAADVFNIPCVHITISPNSIFSVASPPAPTCWLKPNWMPRFLFGHLLKKNQRRGEKICFNRQVTAEINAERKQLYALPYGSNNREVEKLNIGFFPEWFGMRAKDWPEDLKLVGFPLFDVGLNNINSAVENFIGTHGSPLLITMGTGVNDVDEFLAQAQEISSSLNIPVILLGGDVASLKKSPSERVLHLQYVDLGYVTPKCLAIIHHGGMGTLAQAIRASIPQLIRPLKFDQFDNARRIHKLGLGYFLLHAQYTTENVITCIKSLIDNRKLNGSLKSLSHDVLRSSPFIKAADLIEGILG